MEFFSKACSKLILAGEHLVVHGYDGLAIPLLDKQTTIALTQSATPEVHFNSQLLLNAKLAEFTEDLHFYCNLLDLSPQQVSRLSNFSFSVQLPFIGVGLGASASFAVSMLKVLADFAEIKLSSDQLLTLAGLAEKKYHGTPSGIDHSTIIYERPVLLKGPDKTIIPQEFSMPDFFGTVQITNTGKPTESTKDMVAYVTSKMPNFDSQFLSNLNANIPLLINSLKTNDVTTFKHIVNLYGLFLESIPICTQQVILANQEVRARKGAAKVCGAGGLTNGSGIVLSID